MLAQELADALAGNDWARVRQLEPGRVGYSDAQFEDGWGDLAEEYVEVIRAEELAPGVLDLYVGLLARQTTPGGQQTTTYCRVWQVDLNAGTVTQTERGEGSSSVPGWPPVDVGRQGARAECWR